MKQKLLFTLLITIISLKALNVQRYAPFTIIEDADGFTNVREKESSSSKVIDKMSRNQVFEDLNLAPINEDANSDWHLITYAKYSRSATGFCKSIREKAGYIHKSRIQYLAKLPQLKKRIISKDSIEFKNDTLRLLIVTGKLIVGKHKIEKQSGYVVMVDNEMPNGADGVMPQNLVEFKSIGITSGNQLHKFPQKTFQGLFSSNPENMYVAISNDATIFLVMSNGDAAGAYNVVWTIKNNQVINQFVNRDF